MTKLLHARSAKNLMFFSETGQRKVRSLEQRIRRRALRLGLYARKYRGAGGWGLLSAKNGELLTGRLFDWQLEEHLHDMMQQPCPAKAETASPLSFRDQVAQTARRMQSRQQLIQQHAEQPSLSARLRQLVGERPRAVEVLLGVGGPTAGHVQRGI